MLVSMKRPRTPADLAEAIGFLLPGKAANVTGQTVSVGGGRG